MKSRRQISSFLSPLPKQINNHPSTTSQFISTSLFIVWCLANSLYAADAHALLHTSTYSHLYVELTLCQIVFSALIALPLIHPFILHFPRSSSRSTAISAAHFAGSILSNSSYAILGATSTLVWKLSEPFATAFFKIFLQKQPVSPVRMCGIIVVVIGVLIFSGFNTANSLLFSPIVLANIAFPLRNVLMKLNQRSDASSDIPYNPQLAFLTMQVHALPFALGALLLKWCIAPPVPLSLASKLARNSLYFAAYQMSSIALLARLDSLTHAVANLFKRFSSIFFTVVLFRTDRFLPRHVLGLAFTLIGFPVYALGGFIESDIKLKNSARKVFMPLLYLVPCLIILFSSYSGISLIANIHNTTAASPSHPRLPAWVDRPLKLFPDDGIVRNMHRISGLKNPVAPNADVVYQTFDFDHSHMREDNFGNRVWLHATLNILPDFSSKRLCKFNSRHICLSQFPDICNTTMSECKAEDENNEKKHSQLMFYYPTANAFDVENIGQFGTEVNNIEKYGDIFLIIGVGIQEYFEKGNKFCGIRDYMAKIETTPEDFQFTENGRRVLAVHEKLKLPITFRGDFTAKAALNAGYNYGISLGCPSLMLNPNPDAGQVLARKYEALKSRIGDRSLKIAVNIKNECEEFVPIFTRILSDYPNAVVFAQHKKEIEDATNVGFPRDRVRGFVDIQQWQEAIKDMDVSIGVRIHGNMLALSMDVPVLVIATDHRVLELAKRMVLPHTTSLDDKLVQGLDVASLVTSSNFDGDAFDQNRCESAATYQKLYHRYRIPVSKHVKSIAKRCL